MSRDREEVCRDREEVCRDRERRDKDSRQKMQRQIKGGSEQLTNKEIYRQVRRERDRQRIRETGRVAEKCRDR